MAREKEEANGNHIMAMNSMESMLMTSNMDGANLLGQMDKCIKDNSKMILDMAQELIGIQVEKWVNLCGSRVR